MKPEPVEITWDPLTGIEVIWTVDCQWEASKLGRDLFRLGLMRRDTRCEKPPTT